MKYKISSFTDAETFIIYLIDIQLVLKKYTNISQQLQELFDGDGQ